MGLKKDNTEKKKVKQKHAFTGGVPSFRKNSVMETPMQMVAEMNYSGTDPNGSYTGTPADSLETPVQDADDL